MLRELFRSTLYSSSRPFSRSATRRSSFSTLMTSLLPVLREARPRIRFTLSIISNENFCDPEGERGFHSRDHGLVLRGGVGRPRAGGAAGCGAGRAPKSLWKKLSFCGGVAAGAGRAFARWARGTNFPRASASGSTSGEAVLDDICTLASL